MLRRRRSERGFCRNREDRLALFHAMTAPINRDDLRMVQQPVQQRGRQHFVAQQRSPLSKAGVRGQNDRAMLIACRDQLKEVPGLFRREAREPTSSMTNRLGTI